VDIAGRQFDVDTELSQDGEGWIRVHGRVHEFYSVRNDKQVQVWMDGHLYTFELEQGGARRAGQEAIVGAGSGDVVAPMPGTILKVNVAQGQYFEAHAPLVVMESMKMEMTLTAPREGRAKEVFCKVGQLVEMGAVLVRLQP
jgi:acetyl/propionyl-CoA carboxylase alpha subunit